jgi:valyl-tRNA synthetase
MPFITEEIWQALYDGKPPQKSIALAPFPHGDWLDQVDARVLGDLEMMHRLAYRAQFDSEAAVQMAILQDLIVSVRNLRAELKIEPKLKVPIEVFAHEPQIAKLIEENRGAVERLASVAKIVFVEGSLANKPGARSTSRFDVHVIYARKIDVAAECERLRKELEGLQKRIDIAAFQLGNQNFLAKAPQRVVDGLAKQLEDTKVLWDKTQSKLKELGCS